jgi:glucose-1-phosphate adenylyltransferase
MLNAGEKMFSYRFEGYWKDVGTIASLWQANMDLLGEMPEFNVSDKSWKIHSRNPLAPPECIGEFGVVKNSMIALGCEINGTVENSVLFSGVYVAPGAVIRDSVIMNDVRVEAGATVDYTIISTDTTIGEGAVVGAPKAEGVEIAVVGAELTVPAGKTIPAGAMVNADKLAELSK